MSWLRCTTRIASGIASPCAWVGEAVAVPALEGEGAAPRGRPGRSRAAGRACRPPRIRMRSCRPPTRALSPGSSGRSRRALLRAAAGRREGERRPASPRRGSRRRGRASGRGSRSRRRRRWRPRGRGRCSRRSGAAPPSTRVSHTSVVESRGLADPTRKQARAQLRLQRLAERVVLRECQRGDELTEAKRVCREMGCPPDVSARAAKRTVFRTTTRGL